MKIAEVKKKNGSTVYRASVYLGVDQITGKKVKASITARTKKELKAKALTAQADFKANGSTRKARSNINTYSDLLSLWWETYCHTVKVNTQIKVKGRLENYLRPAFGKYKLDKLTPAVIQHQVNQWANDYNQHGQGVEDYSFSHSLNRRILQYAVSIQAIPSNPARDIVVPRRASKEKQGIKYLDSQNLKKFLDYLDSLDNSYKNFYDGVLYKLLLATGLRIGEALALEWSDIDLERAKISVNKTLNARQGINSPKSRSSVRELDIDKKTALMLRLYKARQREKAREAGNSSEIVFTDFIRKYPLKNSLDVRLKSHLKKADCNPVTFHAFRHTHASILLNAGLPYKEIQNRLGHSTLSVTMDTYSHLSPENEKKAVSVFETALENIKSS